MISLDFKDGVYEKFVVVPHHPKLIELTWWFMDNFVDAVVTSAYRKGDPGVHGQVPLRGLDFRSRIYSSPVLIEKIVNDNWIYDTKRPDKKCCLYHTTGKGLHLHMQVHDKTQRR